MKEYRKSVLAWIMALVMALSVTPLAERGARAEDYGKTTATGVRLRKKPSTSADYWFRLPIDYICAYLETTTDSAGVTWYKVKITNPETQGKNIYTGYLHGDYYAPITEEEAAAAGVSASSAASEASSGTEAEAAAASEAASSESTASSEASSSESAASSAASSSESASASAASAESASSGGTGTVSSGYVKTTAGKVNLRATPGGAVVTQVASRGTVLTVTGDAVSKLNYTWYPVKTARNQKGYIRGDFVTACDAGGGAVSSGTASSSSSASSSASSSSSSSTSASSAAAEAKVVSGTDTGTIRTTKSGVNVRSSPAGSNIIGKVKKGLEYTYYEKATAGGYTWYLVKTSYGLGYLRSDCVTEVQAETASSSASASDSSDAGSSAAASAEAEDTSSLSMKIYPAEKIDWFTGGIQELIPKGSNFKIYDVKTGIVWWVHRWAGGNHADIEPLTAADTARLCKIYGVSKASEIKDWQRRPCLITVGSRTFACALYGIPHNSSGDTIKDNNLDGQVCLHFTNSRTHGSNKVVSYNEDAIEYAWEHAPNGHK